MCEIWEILQGLEPQVHAKVRAPERAKRSGACCSESRRGIRLWGAHDADGVPGGGVSRGEETGDGGGQGGPRATDALHCMYRSTTLAPPGRPLQTPR